MKTEYGSEVRTWTVKKGAGLWGGLLVFDHHGNEVENVIRIHRDPSEQYHVTLELFVNMEREDDDASS